MPRFNTLGDMVTIEGADKLVAVGQGADPDSQVSLDTIFNSVTELIHEFTIVTPNVIPPLPFNARSDRPIMLYVNGVMLPATETGDNGLTWDGLAQLTWDPVVTGMDLEPADRVECYFTTTDT